MRRRQRRWRTEMLLIRCPYCGSRGLKLEFSYGGEAHIARPTPPDSGNARMTVGGVPVPAQQSAVDVHAERWRHVRGCARFFNARARHAAPIKFIATYKSALKPRRRFPVQHRECLA